MLEEIKMKFGLTDAQWAMVEHHLVRLELPAKTVLLREGEVANRIFLTEKGCVEAFALAAEGKLTASVRTVPLREVGKLWEQELNQERPVILI